MPPKWWIRGKLRRAGKLLRNGSLNEYQYSYLAIKFGHQLLQEPLVPGTKIPYYIFGARLAEHLGVRNPIKEGDYNKSIARYGPYNAATVKFKTAGQLHLEAVDKKLQMLQETHPVMEWTSDFENAAKQSEILLSPFNRWAFQAEEWWKEQERLLPATSKSVVFILGLIVGGVIGYFLK